MSRPVVEIELTPERARDLAAGGALVPACGLELYGECDLVVRGAGGVLTLAARAVYLDPAGRTGLELIGFDAAMKAALAALGEHAGDAGAPDAPDAPGHPDDPDEPDEPDDPGDPDAGDSETRRIARNVHERLRGLTLAQQVKVAQTGELQERVVLERLYGKTVWEPLLRNPRLTAPEVARIARMGTLPRVLLEVIVGNGAWLQIPEVRRALLANPRLGPDQIVRVLRHLPKLELKVASSSPAYPHAMRDAAKRMIRDADGK